MTFYDVLGVSRDAEPEVIKAAYRALAKKYHPDTTAHEQAYSEARFKEINSAYEVLSNPSERAAYDETLDACHGLAGDDVGVYETVEAETQSEWETALGFYPEIETYYEDLALLSKPTASTFRLLLIESKKFNKAASIAVRLEAEFLKRYFGSNKEIRDYAKRLILSGRKDAAVELNKVIIVLGNSARPVDVVSKIEEKFPRNKPGGQKPGGQRKPETSYAQKRSDGIAEKLVIGFFVVAISLALFWGLTH